MPDIAQLIRSAILGHLPLASQLEGSQALPNATAGTIALAVPTRILDIWVGAGGSCYFSLKGAAVNTGPVLDDTMVYTIRSAELFSTVYLLTASDLRSVKISWRGY
jgi:hypothetical protein